MKEKKRRTLSDTISAGVASMVAVVTILFAIINFIILRSGTGEKVAITASIFMVLFGPGFGFIITKKNTKQMTVSLALVTDRMRAFASGDVTSPIPDVTAGSLELHSLQKDMAQIIYNTSSVINDVTYMLGNMAAGNFSVESGAEQSYLGDYAEILNAENGIKQTLSQTLAEILAIAQQVSEGSEQVSNGAQSLAQGATEQASGVEKMSASISEVASQISENAKSVKQASVLTSESGTIMESTVDAMAQAKCAMEEITVTSHNISKVIKTIDDIAFQTNILALNAAVEAARAGSAGKGFAVVADEVRNLSQKSAEAAANTTSLIENSIVAVEKGYKLVGKASDNFAQVAQKSKEINSIVGDFATDFQQQASAATQISIGIEQIASVVQTNSATSEESAAASEELSTQAAVLKSLVDHFVLEK